MFSLSELRRIIDKNPITIVDGPYGIGKSELIPKYLRDKGYKVVVGVPEESNFSESSRGKIPNFSEDINTMDYITLFKFLATDKNFDICILDATDANLWEAEVILSFWISRKRDAKLVCIGQSIITDRLQHDYGAIRYRIPFYQHKLHRIYAAEEGFTLADLIPQLQGQFCVIDNLVPSRNISSCDIVAITNLQSTYQYTTILAKLGFEKATTIYFLDTKERIYDLPDEPSIYRDTVTLLKMIALLNEVNISPKILIFQKLDIITLLEKYKLEKSPWLGILNWPFPSFQILDRLNEENAGNICRLALCLLSYPGILFNTEGETDDKLDSLIREKFEKYRADTLIGVYFNIATEMYKLKEKELTEWALSSSFYLPPIMQAFSDYVKIKKNGKDDFENFNKLLQREARQIINIDPERLLQYSLEKVTYVNPNDEVQIVNPLFRTANKPLIFSLCQNKNYVYSYIEI